MARMPTVDGDVVSFHSMFLFGALNLGFHLHTSTQPPPSHSDNHHTSHRLPSHMNPKSPPSKPNHQDIFWENIVDLVVATHVYRHLHDQDTLFFSFRLFDNDASFILSLCKRIYIFSTVPCIFLRWLIWFRLERMGIPVYASNNWHGISFPLTLSLFVFSKHFVRFFFPYHYHYLICFDKNSYLNK